MLIFKDLRNVMEIPNWFLNQLNQFSVFILEEKFEKYIHFFIIILTIKYFD